MLLTGYPTSCLTLAVTLVKTTRQQRETLPIAGFALDADKWSGTGSISAGTRAMIWSTPARSITASRRNQKRSCMTASGQSRRFGDVRATSALPLITDVRCEDQQVRKVPTTEVAHIRSLCRKRSSLAAMVIRAARLAAILLRIAKGLRPA